VNPAAPPAANAGSNQTINLPATSTTLDGSASTGATSIMDKRVWSDTPAITTPANVTTTVTGLVQGTLYFNYQSIAVPVQRK